MMCFIRSYPDEPVTRSYKIKERHVVSRVRDRFPEFTWICDKRYDFAPTDCASRRRPDMFCHFGTHVLIVEVDEYQHKAYDTSCNNKRLCELYQDFGHVPIVFIRFNPDAYVDHNGHKVTSCFRYSVKTGVCTLIKSKMNEFDERMNDLFTTIERYVNPTTICAITQEHLFYDLKTTDNS